MSVNGKVIDKTDEIMQNQFLYIEKIKHINAEKTAIDKKQFKYDIRIFGCQMNEHDAEKLAGMLEEMGYVKVSEGEPADIVIFETCCVRENAEEKIYGHLGMLKPSKGDNKGVIAVTGCMMQQPHVVEKIKKSYRHVDIVFGTHNLHAFPELLYKHLTTGKRVFDIWDAEGLTVEGVPAARADRVKAWVNIVLGCNNYCSYCIVPYVRGRERSRRKEDIVSEVENAGLGYKEITLLGQNVNSYGNDLGMKDGFASLLYALNDIKGIERIRL